MTTNFSIGYFLDCPELRTVPEKSLNKLLEAITELTDEAYVAIIKLLGSESFLETFEDDTDSLQEFISNFTHFTDDLTSSVPKSIINKALKKGVKWRCLEISLGMMNNRAGYNCPAK